MSKKYSFILIIIVSSMILFSNFLKGNEGNTLKINSIDAEIIESLDQEILSLRGNVVIKTDIVQLWSDKAIYDRANQTIQLEGNIKALSKNLSIKAQNMEADFIDNEFYLSSSIFNFMERGFGESQFINLEFNGDIELLNISITSCKKEDLSWNLNSERITILENRKNAVIKDVTIKVNEIPILYLPYARTAIGKEKFSGFLSPSIKQGKDGLDLSVPYFFSLAPNYDLTISPRYIEKRGSGISSEGRFLTQDSEGLIAFSYFISDRRFLDQTGENKKRWATKVNSQTNIGSNLYLSISTEHVSDDLYFEDLNDDILGTQQKDFLVRNLNVGLNTKNLKIIGRLKQFHNLNPFSSNEYKTQPHLNFEYQGNVFGMSARLVTDYAKFSYDEKFNPIHKESDLKRIYIEPSLSFEKGFKSSLTSFEAGRRETEYQTKLDPIDNTYNWAELSYRIYMEKKSKNQFRSLSPIIKYVYIDGENNYEKGIDSKLQNLNFDTLFERNWYSGSDFFLEQNRLILGFEHNFYNSSNGNERYFSLGRAFFRDKESSLNNNSSKKSSIVSEFKANLSGHLKINSSLELNSDLKKISRGSFGIIYEREESKNIQLRSIYKRNPKYLNSIRGWSDDGLPINQIELISEWELSSKFLVFGKVSRDYEKNYSRDISYGIEYRNCCLKLGLVKRKWLDQNYYPFFGMNKEDINLIEDNPFTERERDNVYLFFELTELGRFGKRISEVLSSRRFQ